MIFPTVTTSAGTSYDEGECGSDASDREPQTRKGGKRGPEAHYSAELDHRRVRWHAEIRVESPVDRYQGTGSRGKEQVECGTLNGVSDVDCCVDCRNSGGASGDGSVLETQNAVKSSENGFCRCP